MPVFHVDVDAVSGCPVLVDLGEDGGDEAQQRCLVRKDADLLGPALDLLLNGPLDRVRCPHAAAVRLRQGEDGESLGDVRLYPLGEPRRGLAVALCQGGEFRLGGLQIPCVPDGAQVLADALADGERRGVVNGVLG